MGVGALTDIDAAVKASSQETLQVALEDLPDDACTKLSAALQAAIEAPDAGAIVAGQAAERVRQDCPEEESVRAKVCVDSKCDQCRGTGFLPRGFSPRDSLRCIGCWMGREMMRHTPCMCRELPQKTCPECGGRGLFDVAVYTLSASLEASEEVLMCARDASGRECARASVTLALLHDTDICDLMLDNLYAKLLRVIFLSSHGSIIKPGDPARTILPELGMGISMAGL
eukprot:TRINITY_DN26879_c0_g1_i1.p1 TRINITY_DN26879_c0_g1~~TRINITY_DN26879_c0_g1_i1.p1  ORF type:complete len:228 (+),score=13.30 TRINITY_DN26879_c0_g1_i1:56-739(+)